MISDLKQFGMSVVRHTIRRYVIRTVVGGVLLVGALAYRSVTSRSLEASNAPAAAPAATPPSAPVAAASPAAHPATASTADAAPAPSGPASGPERAPAADQGYDLNAPKRAAQKAADASNARISAQTGQAPPARDQKAVQAGTPISGPGSAGVPATPSGTIAGVSAAHAPAAGKVAETVTRESFGYAGQGRRDPFYSLILTDDLRPLLADLRLVGILYEASGRRTVAVMRDVQTNAQYRVTNGSSLGRMRVAQIRPKAVIFSIDEFGLSRQDSLVWSDTTRVRN